MPVPKLRFKEFDGEWAETSFQDLFIFKNGVNASKEQYGSGIKFINVLDIINNPNGITYDSIIGSVDITSKEIDKNLVKYGDVLFQRSSETREEVGQSNVYLGKEPVVFGGFVIRGSAQKEYDPIFMNGLLKTDSLRDQITQLSGGSTRFNIGQDSLNKVSAYLPSKLEQTKIASFLSAVDEKISLLTKKHELLWQYKQGMMQKLFSQQIRFKADDGSEFGEWENKTLGDITELVSRRNKSDIDAEIYSVTNSQGFVKQNEYFEDRRIAGEDTSSYKIIKRNEFAYNPARINVGSIALFNAAEIGIISSLYVCFSVNENTKISFLEYFLKLDSTIKNYGLYGEGGVRIYLWYPLFSKIPFNIPCLEEQTKITNFLSAIDQKIEVVAKQIEQAKQWKKGLLQQMFV